ncbi:MAG: hypothetical protein AB1546_12275 [bacterium]
MSDSEKLNSIEQDTISLSAPRDLRFCSQFRDVPVVCIETGEELGRVHGFLVDDRRGVIAGFVLGTSAVERGLKVAPFGAVSSFGGFALTVSKSSDITDLIASPYFLALFEKDLVLLGSRIIESGGKSVGFVQDAGIDVKDGSIVLLKITSDVGFMSPYRATIPYAAVEKIEHDTITLRKKEQVTFKKDIPGVTEEEYSYVPLVLKEEEIKEVLVGRLAEEMEKVRREVQKSLEAEFYKFFLIYQKTPMQKEIIASLEKYIDEALAGRFENLREELTAEIRRILENVEAKKTTD